MTKTPRDEHLTELLLHLKGTHGFDLTGYKESSLRRRIRRRMDAVGAATFPAYQAWLEDHPEEYANLFDSILINVTSFFRDTECWEYLAAEVLPGLLAAKGPGEPIRAWSVGCATGEEPYTLCMVLADHLGPDAFRDRVKVYATDMDDDALAFARHARYSPKDVEGVLPELRERHFELGPGGFAVRGDLRRAVVFGRHDVTQDAPISRLDIVLCRNTLMYFDSSLQARVLRQLHFGLREQGVLFLGRAETLLGQDDIFEPVSLRHHVFRKATRVFTRMAPPMLDAPQNPGAGLTGRNDDHLRGAALDMAPPMLVVDEAGTLRLANLEARELLRIGSGDVGRPLKDLEVSYRPLELRSLIDRAHEQKKIVTVREFEWVRPQLEPMHLDVIVGPMFDDTGSILGTSILYTDVSSGVELRAEIRRTQHELETAYEELQSTNEELETTNEELQCTVEELETTNEELQSTNEELETMNEELQSTNEELETMNDELRQRSDQVSSMKAFHESILASLNVGVIVADKEQRVLVWNRRAEDLWGLRCDEVAGQFLLSLDFGLPVERLKPDIRSILTGAESLRTVDLPAINRRGRSISCSIVMSPLIGPGGITDGIILLMTEGEA